GRKVDRQVECALTAPNPKQNVRAPPLSRRLLPCFPMKFLRLFLAGSIAAFSLTACSKKSDSADGQLKVGFAQTGAESAWRTANTQSMRSEAEKRGVDLKFADGQSKQENQIRALRSFIAQRVDAIVLAPIVE